MTTHDYPIRKIKPPYLDSTMVLVGESGGLSAIYDVEPTSAWPGLSRIETEHGELYIARDFFVDVLDA